MWRFSFSFFSWPKVFLVLPKFEEIPKNTAQISELPDNKVNPLIHYLPGFAKSVLYYTIWDKVCVYCATRYIIIWLESNIKYSIVEPGFSGNVDGNYEKGSLPLYNMVSGCARRKWLQSRQETPSASSPTPPTRVLGGRQAHAFRPRGWSP